MKPKSLPSRLFERNSTASSGENPSVHAAKYQRHVDSVDHPERLDLSVCNDGQQVTDNSKQNGKCYKEIHFAFLPKNYEPLVDDEAKEARKKKQKEKYKKVKKNVGKALRMTWKCLMLGLYNFALGYSTPITAAAAFVPDLHQSRKRT